MDVEVRLKNLKEKIKNITNQKQDLLNKEYNLNEEYVILLQGKCRKNIGRCFKKMEYNKIVGYYRIINIDTTYSKAFSGTIFNEYQYFLLCFKYPYDNTLIPFNKIKLHINDLENKSILNSSIKYIEIDDKEFFNEFNKVNLLWTNKLQL